MHSLDLCSKAAREGLRAGMILWRVDGKKMTTTEEIALYLGEKIESCENHMFVFRFFITTTTEEEEKNIVPFVL